MTLCAAANLAYLRLEKDNMGLCDWVDNLQWVFDILTRIYHFKHCIQNAIDHHLEHQIIALWV